MMGRSFVDLPDIVRRRIYHHLFAGPPTIPITAWTTPRTEYHLNILRTCKDVYEDGLDVLRANKFIFLSSNQAQIDEGSRIHNVPHTILQAKSFCPYSIAEIKFDTMVPGLKRKRVRFLIRLAALPKFVFMLRALIMSNQPKYNYQFILADKNIGQITAAAVMALLQTLKVCDKGLEQKVVFSGDWEERICVEVAALINTDVFWLRGLAWDLYGLATIKRQLVLSAFEQSDIQLAHDRSTDVLSFLDACNERNAAIKDVDDNDYWMSWKQLDIVTWFNMQRIRLSLGFSTNDKSRFEDVLKENDAQTKKVCGNSYITSVAAAAIHHYRGIAKYALWRAKGALTAFATGLEFDSKHPGIEKCVQITKATMDGVKPSQHHDLIQCMLDTLPVGLLQTKIFKITKSPKDLQRERYTLKELRYCGSMLDPYPTLTAKAHKSQSKITKGLPANVKKEADAVVADIRRQRRLKGARQPFMIGNSPPEPSQAAPRFIPQDSIMHIGTYSNGMPWIRTSP